MPVQERSRAACLEQGRGEYLSAFNLGDNSDPSSPARGGWPTYRPARAKARPASARPRQACARNAAGGISGHGNEHIEVQEASEERDGTGGRASAHLRAGARGRGDAGEGGAGAGDQHNVSLVIVYAVGGGRVGEVVLAATGTGARGRTAEKCWRSERTIGMAPVGRAACRAPGPWVRRGRAA